MAISSDPGRIGKGSLAVPDPKLNASQILAWAICWPWNLLWTVCAYNPVFWLIEVAVREFRSGLEEISSGQFREIDRELMVETATPPLVVAPSLAGAERSALVVGDPLLDWPPEAGPPANENKRIQPAPSPVAVNTVTEGAGERGGGDALGGGDAREASGTANAAGPWSWAPPAVERERQASSQPANWYPVGELKSAPEVSSTQLKSAVRKQSEGTSSSASIPPSVLDVWYNLPPADGRSSRPLN